MKKKIMGILLCAMMTVQTFSPVLAEDLLSAGTAEVQEEYSIEAPVEETSETSETSEDLQLGDGVQAVGVLPQQEETPGIADSEEEASPVGQYVDWDAAMSQGTEHAGHDIHVEITKASFTDDGVIVKVCDTCGQTVENIPVQKITNVSLSQTRYSYNGTVRKPSVVLKDSAGKQIPADFYKVEAPASKIPGVYSMTITMDCPYYTGIITPNYEIVKANQKIELSDQTKRIDYKTVTLKAKITQGNKTGKFSYKSDNPEVASVTSWGKVTFHREGSAKITATTKGTANYNSASKTITVTVVPAPTVVTKLQSQRKGWLNIQYRANRDADGYQIQYGTSDDMSNAKYAAVENSAIRSYTRKDAIPGAAYHVRVRTFKYYNGKRYYSNWSGIKHIQVREEDPVDITPWGKLRNYIRANGYTSAEGNKYIGFSYGEDNIECYSGIFYNKKTEKLEFMTESDVVGESASIMSMTLELNQKSMWPRLDFYSWDDSVHAVMSRDVEMSSYKNGSRIEFYISSECEPDMDIVFDNYDLFNDLANILLQSGFEDWKELTDKAGVSLKSLGFTSYNG